MWLTYLFSSFSLEELVAQEMAPGTVLEMAQEKIVPLQREKIFLPGTAPLTFPSVVVNL